MSWQTAEFNEALSKAAEEFNQVKASELCHDLIEHLCARDDPYPVADAKHALRMLRARRYFDLLQRVGDALIQNGQNLPVIRRLYAQSQLDLGNLTAAINTLTILENDTGEKSPSPDKQENYEARGLLGRAYKDLYLLTGKVKHARTQHFLEQAIGYYQGVYDQDKNNVWHGINSVALIHRAKADAVELGAEKFQQADTMAAEILGWVKQQFVNDASNVWDYATALEACIALGKHKDALKWLSLYLDDEDTDAFELGSTYRQLTELWRLNPGISPGNKILPVLKARLLEKRGGEVEISIKDAGRENLDELVENEGFEQVFGSESFKSLKWFNKCMQRARAVAQVLDSNDDAVGTAFVVRGGDFYPDWGDELLFLTNAHVICNEAHISRALLPAKAILKFDMDAESNPTEFRVKQLWSSDPEKLDATLLKPDPPIQNIAPMPIAQTLPVNDGAQRAYIIGHPQGRRLSFSIHDNHLLDYDDRLLHYRSPTEPGNSGSPVFNDDWELIGLHHRGLSNMPRLNGHEGTYPANEGIWIQAVLFGCYSELSGLTL